LLAKNISASATALNKITGEPIDSLVTIAALRKASCTSSDATWSDVLVVEGKALYCGCPYDDRFIDEPRTKT
jgi:hypothetical protein